MARAVNAIVTGDASRSVTAATVTGRSGDRVAGFSGDKVKGLLGQAAVAIQALVGRASSLGLQAAVSVTPQSIASNYPNDVGIGSDPSVLFADTFESYANAADLTGSGNYSTYFQGSNVLVDTAQQFSGAKALRLRMPTSGVEVSNALVKTIAPDRDEVYVRVYQRYQAGYQGLSEAHNGMRFTANYTGPGTIPSGTDFMYVGIEASRYRGEAEPGYIHAYVYHPEQNDSYGEHWYPSGFTSNGDGPNGGFGAGFVARSEVLPTLGVWQCYEVRVKLNTVGQRDGQVTVWLDGSIIADWGNIRFRDSTAVKIDEIQFENGGKGSTQINDKWYDNLVVATSYIGPMASAAAATAITMTGPSSGTVLTPSSAFTVGANGAVSSSIIVTPSSGGGGGTFTPTTVTLTAAAPTATFTYTPSTEGVKTISVTNNQGLANPANIAYTSTAAGSGAHWPNGTVNAASNSQAAVQAAINAAVSGQVVVIPNGSVSWSSGVTVNKGILLRAATINPTSGGRSNQSLVITNNSGSTAGLFAVTTGNTHHVGIAGIRFNEGSQQTPYVRVGGSGSKPCIIYDCCVENIDRHGSSHDISCLTWEGLGGLMWRVRVIGVPDSFDGIGAISGAMVIASSRAWNTASTMGMLDTNGNINVYFEDGSCLNTGLMDIDNAGRFVFRYSLHDGSFSETHGFTSGLYNGGRHWEYYNNTFSMSTPNRNMARYWWVRAGTGIWADNVVNSAATPGQFGDLFISIGDITSPGSYPMAMQPGYGHNGTTDVSDPMYSWNNSGARADNIEFANGWGSIVQIGRDLYKNSGAKPGYSKYTYPHPFTTGCPTS